MVPATARVDAVTLGEPDRDTLALSGVLTFATAARAYAEGGRALAAVCDVATLLDRSVDQPAAV